MVKLLIIADDYTGAIDTGVQFAEAGARTKVVTDLQYDFSKMSDRTDVIVIDTESRHISSKKAYQIIFDLSQRAFEQGVPLIFKKTDSALRGNIGSELTAVLEASGEAVLPFVPAFPEMNRVTIDGNHYIDGDLLENSVFCQDPFEPAVESNIPNIIALQSDVHTDVVHIGEEDSGRAEGYRIVVYDCETNQQMLNITKKLQERKQFRVLAGCAGFASALPEILGIKHENKITIHKNQSFFAVCGSVNPITVRQIDYAAHHGFVRFRLTPRQKLEQGYWETEQGKEEQQTLLDMFTKETLCIVDSNDLPGSNDTVQYAKGQHICAGTIRSRIPKSLGSLIQKRMAMNPKASLMIMGGDTLLGFFDLMKITEVEPIAELMPGTVLSSFWVDHKSYQVITKSGGFGKESLLVEIAEKLISRQEERGKQHG